MNARRLLAPAALAALALAGCTSSTPPSGVTPASLESAEPTTAAATPRNVRRAGRRDRRAAAITQAGKKHPSLCAASARLKADGHPGHGGSVNVQRR